MESFWLSIVRGVGTNGKAIAGRSHHNIIIVMVGSIQYPTVVFLRASDSE